MGALKETLRAVLNEEREKIKSLVSSHGDRTVDQVTLAQVFQGSRGIVSIFCDTSAVPPAKGLIVRGYPIGELAGKLPEDVFYLLLAGKLPTDAQRKNLQDEWAARNTVPDYVWKVVDALPQDTHPMTMLNTAVLCMQRESVFAKRYAEGMAKDEYWETTLEDALALTARLPAIAAYVYRRCFNKGPRLEGKPGLDWAGDYVQRLGFADPKGELTKLMRLYLVLHSDHGGGNVSANVAGTVNSALSDLYYALSAGLNGLAGPLHGLANQECLAWIQDLMEQFKGTPSVEQISKFAEETIAAKRVVPGYGHAVLRVTDPRFSAFVEFGKQHCPGDPVFKTALNVYEAVPKVLQKHPKIKNPWPNVDAVSGSLLHHYGLTEQNYYTVLFSLSRALGICAQAVHARGCGLPIVRPTALTYDELQDALKT
ncbi:MAG: citrate (Si)-synthase [Planctomycetota bacterium]|nr:citrate (Si)-synthase [Planctomycetota bacterium]